MVSWIRASATRHKTVLVGAALLALLIAAAVFAPLLATADPAAMSPIPKMR